MLKKDIRKIYREKRSKLSLLEKEKLDDLLLIQLQTAALPFANALLSFWPISKNNEPNTHLFTDYIEFKNPGILIAYPKADFVKNKMISLIVDEDTEFIRNEFDLFEPDSGIEIVTTDLDIIFVPLLAFDRAGFRVGYGKGFYDKYLATCKPGCIKIGFSYFEPIDEIADKHEFDVPLDLCITPQNIYVF